MAPFHRMTYGTHLNFRETTRMLIGLGRPPEKDEKVAICNAGEGDVLVQEAGLIERVL